ncbi:MAG TPA: hypothetical protein VJW23_17195 [Propionibacteriaceae bacterium]|nr:hypothetical protein [Propionibacteriaceae bacterium]
MGRRSGVPNYTDEEKDEIIAHVMVNVASGRFVSRVFREDKTTGTGIAMPAVSTFWLWMFENQEFSDKLALARQAGIEALLDEVIDITDNVSNDTVTDDNGNDRANTEWISRSRLRAEYRVKLAQMMKPKTYGPKLDLTSDGKQIGTAEALEAARRREMKRNDESRG